jgi:hypothetical protein
MCIGDRYRIGAGLFEMTSAPCHLPPVDIQMKAPRMAAPLVLYRRSDRRRLEANVLAPCGSASTATSRHFALQNIRRLPHKIS